MSFPSALDSTAYTKLRGNGAIAPTYAADQYLCLGANTTVFAARVAQATFGDSFAQVTFDTVTTGAYSDVEIGMTVLISHTNDRRAAFFVGRIRLAPTSAILYLNETSAAVADNDYIFVLNDYRLFGKLGRESGAIYYKDYANTFTPPGPLIYNLQSAYAGVVSGSPAGYTVSFAALALAVTSGASISSYAYTIPSGGTVTAGAANTANVTVRFDARAAEYWVKLIVTDSGGRTSTRHIPVWAIPADLSTTVALGFEGASIERDSDSGQLASVKAFTGVDTILDNTLACILSVERYNNAATFIVSNIEFVGRIRTGQYSTRADFIYSRLSEGAYDIEGIGAQLARLSAPSIYMRSKTSPAVWDEIKDLTLWRAMWYLLFHSTFHELHSLTFDETGSTYLYPAIQTQGGNLFDAISDLAQSITAGMEFATSGECKIARNANYQTTAERNALATVANFTEDDWLDFNLTHEEIETIGAVGGDGGSFNTTSGKVLALLGNAPKVAQGNADGTSGLSRQILTANLTKAGAQSELATRLGHHYAYANPVDTLNVTFPDGYHWLIPSQSQWYTFTIAASENTGGRVYTTAERWFCQNVSFEHNHSTGGRSVTATFRKESVGTPGKAYEPPASNEGTVVIPPIPPLPPFPAIGTPPDIYLPPNPDPEDVPPPIVFDVPTNGNSVVERTALGGWASTDWLLTNAPTRNEVTPSELNGTVHGGTFGFGTEFYLLESDGTDSWVWYTEDIFASAPVWTSSPAISGEYTEIRATSTSGTVYILSRAQTEQGVLVTFDGLNWIDYTVNYGTESSNRLNVETADLGAGNGSFATIEIDLGAEYVISNVSLLYNATNARPDLAVGHTVGIYDASHVSVGSGGGDVAGVADGTDRTRSIDLPDLVGRYVEVSMAWLQNFGPPNDGWIDNVTVTASSAATVSTRYSTDNAATFASIRTAGDSAADFTGIDTSKIGTTVLTGADNVVMKANSGGAYASYVTMPTGAQPQAIHIPTRLFGGTTYNNTTSPDFLVASGTLSSGAALWKSISGTLSDITPNIGGVKGLATSPNCLDMPWWTGLRIAAVLAFGTVNHLVTTENAGTAWSDRGEVAGSFVRYRKGDKLSKYLFIANGVPAYSPDHGANTYNKTHPSPSGSSVDPVIFVLPFG